jgi:hypothetical protein
MLTRVRPTDTGREVVHHQNDFPIYCDDFCWHCGTDDDESALSEPDSTTIRETVIHNNQHSALHAPQSSLQETAIEVEDQGIVNKKLVFGKRKRLDNSIRRFT